MCDAMIPFDSGIKSFEIQRLGYVISCSDKAVDEITECPVEEVQKSGLLFPPMNEYRLFTGEPSGEAMYYQIFTDSPISMHLYTASHRLTKRVCTKESTFCELRRCGPRTSLKLVYIFNFRDKIYLTPDKAILIHRDYVLGFRNDSDKDVKVKVIAFK